MEYGLKYITFYVQKHIIHWLVRDKPLGAPAIRETRLLLPDKYGWWNYSWSFFSAKLYDIINVRVFFLNSIDNNADIRYSQLVYVTEKIYFDIPILQNIRNLSYFLNTNFMVACNKIRHLNMGWAVKHVTHTWLYCARSCMKLSTRQNIRQIPRYNKAIASVWCLIWTYQLQFKHQLNYSLCMYVINIVVTLVVLRERSREITVSEFIISFG